MVGRQIVLLVEKLGTQLFQDHFPFDDPKESRESLRQAAEHHVRVHVCRLPLCLFETRRVVLVYPTFVIKRRLYMYMHFFNGGFILEGCLDELLVYFLLWI